MEKNFVFLHKSNWIFHGFIRPDSTGQVHNPLLDARLASIEAAQKIPRIVAIGTPWREVRREGTIVGHPEGTAYRSRVVVVCRADGNKAGNGGKAVIQAIHLVL